MPELAPVDDVIDRDADIQIGACLSLTAPQSFFLFAGAGSGKTRSLVGCLERLRRESSTRLRLRGQRIAVITYTNAASNEIQERLNHDPLIEVSTIHSFVWKLVKGFNSDIRHWLRDNLSAEIAELEALQAKGRPGKASSDRAKSIENKRGRLALLDQVKVFTYNPNGDNRGRDSLNHSEVLKIGADFLRAKPTLQRILVSTFPILLIDESQDTNRLLMEAFFVVQQSWQATFCLGLFGDMMQRIYADGKADLGRDLPADWAKPAKRMNHRCPKRIIKLINRIREGADGQHQEHRSDKEEGFVRIYILANNVTDKESAEREIAQLMSTVTGDSDWEEGPIKTLILEHHMAATRMNFLPMFEPLYRNGVLRMGLLDGSLPGLRFFSDLVLPLVQAKRAGNEFKVAAIVRDNSPLLSAAALKAAGNQHSLTVVKAREAVNALVGLWAETSQPRFIDVLRNIRESNLFEIPESLSAIAGRSADAQELAEQFNDVELDGGDEQSAQLTAWDRSLVTRFEQIERYKNYVDGTAEFGTHQGVKGLEFPRVMVVIDDEEARGFLFSYEKLFGAKAKTKTDLDHERAGEETGIDRTRRLFYVTCSRAENSLAIVCYSEHPQVVRDYVIAEGWFAADEVALLS